MVTHISRQLQNRIQECNQMTQEYKKMEHAIHQLQMDKSVLLQGQPSAPSNAYIPPQA